MKRIPASLSEQMLQQVWKDSRDSKSSTAGSPGVDQVTADRFRSELRRNIADIRDEIRAGGYRFSRLRAAPIAKEKGGYRIIAIPTVRDRLLQRALLRHLEVDKRFHATSSISFGFTKGLDLEDAYQRALELRKKHPWVLQTDIVRFFDEIPRRDLKDLIKRKVRSRTIANLLCAAVDSELAESDAWAAEKARENGIRRGRGLRQGMPVSPMLSNLLLRDFDADLTARGLAAIRYADDIAVFADSREECQDALQIIKESLRRRKLRVPDLAEDGKTKIREPSHVAEFLGLDIKRRGGSYELAIPFRKLEKIRDEMAAIASVERCVRDRRRFAQVERSLDSFIAGHVAAVSAVRDTDQFLARAIQHKRAKLDELLAQLIGEPAMRKLSPVARSILGLQPFERDQRPAGPKKPPKPKVT